MRSSGGSRIFPRGGREPSRGGVNTPNFPENCMKSKEFGCPGGACVPHAPPRSANEVDGNSMLPRRVMISRRFSSKRAFQYYCKNTEQGGVGGWLKGIIYYRKINPILCCLSISAHVTAWN